MNTAYLTLLTIVLPLLGAGIGYLLKEKVERKKTLEIEVIRERREHYQQFVDLIINLLKQSKEGNSRPEDFLSSYYEFYKKYILYASPSVISAFSDYFQCLFQANEGGPQVDHKTHFRLLTRILTAMRRDLGLDNKNLGKDGEVLLRAIINDFDKIMKQ